MSTSVQLTVFTKNRGPLTKHLSLAADGSVKSDSTQSMARGQACRKEIAGVEQFAELIVKLKSNQAIGLGRLRGDLADEVGIVTKDMLNGNPHLIARTATNIVFEKSQPALVLFDYDTKGMPPGIAARMNGGFWEALETVAPTLKGVGRLLRNSTSAGLVNTDTGQQFPGSGGLHGYAVAADGADIERFLKTLHDRCWLAGLGWHMIGRTGQLLERSIIDRMVGTPERLVFEGPPIVEPPLTQDAESRRPKVSDGGMLDTLAACPPLTVVEKQTLGKLKAEAAQALAKDRLRARDAYVVEFAARKKLTADEAATVLERQLRGVLGPGAELEFDDASYDGFTVADILDNPAMFDGVKLADPNEGAVYDPDCAMILRHANGVPWIHSFAHGRSVYELKYDVASVRERVSAGREPIKLILAADLDEIELKLLIDEIAPKFGGVRAITAKIKAARQQQAADKAREWSERELARRSDPRPQLTAPSSDAPWIPIVATLNEVLPASPTTPTRNIDGGVSRVRKRKFPSLHQFSSKTANQEKEEGDE